MNDKEYKTQKKRVEKYLKKWIKPMGIKWHRLDVIFDRNYEESDKEILANSQSLWQYRKASITFYLPVVDKCSDDDLEHNVVHELVHILLAPLWYNCNKSDEMSQINEYTVESITNAFIWCDK